MSRYIFSAGVMAAIVIALALPLRAQEPTSPPPLTGTVYWGPGAPTFNSNCGFFEVLQYTDSFGGTYYVLFSSTVGATPVQGSTIAGPLDGNGNQTWTDESDNTTLPVEVFFRATTYAAVRIHCRWTTTVTFRQRPVPLRNLLRAYHPWLQTVRTPRASTGKEVKAQVFMSVQ